MMDGTIGIFCLIISVTAAAPITTTSSPNTSTTLEHGFLSPKPLSVYEVTENVIDIPDNRTLPPIVANYTIAQPLNLANTSLTVKPIKNNTAENSKVKKTSFTYVHVYKDGENEGGLIKLFKGFKDYVFNFKKGVVDRLHRYFHKNDEKKTEDKEKEKEDEFGFYSDAPKKGKDVDFHEKFLTEFESDDNFDDYNFDEFKPVFEK